MRASEVDLIMQDLRDGKLRHIGPKVKRLRPVQARAVSDEARRMLGAAVSKKWLAPSHRWLATALQFLAPPDAGDVLTAALKQSINMSGCCGCTMNRLMRALGAVRPPQAIPVLTDVIAQVDNPLHKHLAAVCIDKIARQRDAEAAAVLRSQRERLRRELNRLDKQVAATKPVKPDKPWQAVPGSPAWFAAADRAAKAITRLLERKAA